MNLTIEVKPEVQAELAAQAKAHGMDVLRYAASLLEKAVAPPVECAAGKSKTSREEIRAWLNSMAEFSDRIPPMPGETFSREMIYQDHD